MCEDFAVLRGQVGEDRIVDLIEDIVLSSLSLVSTISTTTQHYYPLSPAHGEFLST